MTLIRDDQIQAAFLANIKANTALLVEIDADEIKEIEPQTTDFSYPAIRIRVGPNNPGEDNCPQDVTIRIAVFSEEASSQQAMRIAGIIMQQYHEYSFTGSGLGQSVRFGSISVSLIPVVRQDRRTWRAELILTSLISSG